MMLSELRKVRLYFREGNHTEYFMHENQVQTYLQASLELHHWPGKNPWNGCETAQLWYVTVESFSEPHAYWWSTPGLDKDRKPFQEATIKGAEVSSFSDRHARLWAHPELLEQERQQYLAEDEAERRMELE